MPNATVLAPVSRSLTTLLDKLREMFQLDRGDLDFGIYRIMNFRRAEIDAYLARELPAQVRDVLEAAGLTGTTDLKRQLDQKVAQARGLDLDPDTVPAVRELRERLAREPDTAAVEDEVYSHLFKFFNRYYDDGDFISQRRAKDGAYLIPYEGQEVKLHWANHDQYYVKSSVSFSNYTFKLEDGRRVRFRVVQAETERDNNKAAKDKQRRFRLAAAGQEGDGPVAVEDGDLIVRFTYTAAEEKAKQDALNAATAETLLGLEAVADWRAGLAAPTPTPADAERRMIDKHLATFTAKNSFDYFIHKDLRRFLLRELEQYVKDEVVSLDALEAAAAEDNPATLKAAIAKSRAIRDIAKKIIAFLSQLEDFQKKLWLKKKFVIETQWCVTLDRVPEDLYPEIAANEAQRAEWVRLFAIDRIKGDLAGGVAYPKKGPLTAEFLKANSFLVLDTRHFGEAFTAKLLASFDDVDAQTDGLLVHGENFGALNLIDNKVREGLKIIYLDPPYNTGSDGFLYKDSYQSSSWASMMWDRLEKARNTLAEDGAIAISIGDEEDASLRRIMDEIFGKHNFVAKITVKRASVTGHKVINPGVVNIAEFLLIYAKNKVRWIGNIVYGERERDERYSSFISNINESYNDWKFCSLLDAFAKEKGIAKGALKDTLGERYSTELDEFVYRNPNSVIQPATVSVDDVGEDFRNAVAESKNDPDKVKKYSRDGYDDVYLFGGKKILFYSGKVAEVAGKLVTTERASDIWVDTLPNDLHNEGGVSLPSGKKPEALLARICDMLSNANDMGMDFFAGTATSAAVFQKKARKWIAIEGASYFDSITLTRLKNTLHGEQRGISGALGWKGGGCFKVIRLESYEDALDNLKLERSAAQADFLNRLEADSGAGGGRMHPMKVEYLLSRMLETEAAGASLLDLDRFADPTGYTLTVTRDGEPREVRVDLLETFNYLIGLTVRHVEAPLRFRAAFERLPSGRLVVARRGLRQDAAGPWWFRTVEGTLPDGEKALIVWRTLTGDMEQDNAVLDAFVNRIALKTRDAEYDTIWVNGDNNLQNLHLTPDDGEDEDGDGEDSPSAAPEAPAQWKIRLIEDDFHRLMFAEGE